MDRLVTASVMMVDRSEDEVVWAAAAAAFNPLPGFGLCCPDHG
jgi:hypothetical protein